MKLEIYGETLHYQWNRRVMSVDPGGTTGVNTLVDNVVRCFQLERWSESDWILGD